MLNKFADIFVTDSMQEFIRYKMVQFGLSTCLDFISSNKLMVPDFIKHEDGDIMDEATFVQVKQKLREKL